MGTPTWKQSSGAEKQSRRLRMSTHALMSTRPPSSRSTRREAVSAPTTTRPSMLKTMKSSSATSDSQVAQTVPFRKSLFMYPTSKIKLRTPKKKNHHPKKKKKKKKKK